MKPTCNVYADDLSTSSRVRFASQYYTFVKVCMWKKLAMKNNASNKEETPFCATVMMYKYMSRCFQNRKLILQEIAKSEQRECK